MKSLITMLGAAGMALAVSAAQNDLLLTFSTPGNPKDTYADGATVIDGECYALVWSADGVFEGIKDDGTPADPNDKVVLVAPLAKDGRCPTVVYQVDAALAEQLKNGQYAVYLLDTRVSATEVAGLKNGALARVNGLVPTGVTTAGGQAEIASAESGTAVDGVAAAQAGIAQASVVDEPTITAFKVDGAKITVTVSGMSPVAEYKVYQGTGLDKKLFTEAQGVTKDGDTFSFQKPAEATFFSVKGEHRKFSK